MPASKPANLNILVADDEKATTVSVAFVLKHSGYSVDAVSDGEEALTRLKEDAKRYQILITDHTMLNVSGLQLISRLHETDFRGKVVVLSGHLTRELREAYEEAGVDRVITKPFDLVDLRRAVEDLGATIHN